MTFLSELFGGSLSDNEITLSCGVLDKLKHGDSVMVDKGFLIEKHCVECGVILLGKDCQMSPADIVKTWRIASLHAHVERAIERLKNFHILDFFPCSIFDIADAIGVVCAMLCNFYPHLVV